jgi:two-component system chemotaxis sensor kinase CheA
MTAEEPEIQVQIEKLEEAPASGQTPAAGMIQLQEAFRQEAALPKNPALRAAEPPSLPEAAAPQPPADGGLADDPELIADFVLEARDHLSKAETNLLALEKDPGLPDAVHSVFRSFHTIKGLTGFLALGPLQEVSHETETILQQARDGQAPLTPRLIDLALKAADYIRIGLDALSVKPPREAMQSLPSNGTLLREIVLAAASPEAAEETAPPVADKTAPYEPAAIDTRPEGTPVSAKGSDASVVRVDTAKLEYLVEMVGELVIAQSLIHFGDESGGSLSRHFAHLGRVTGEIQKAVLSMRMVPISRLYDRMARLVRDLARKSGKSIELRRIGDEVELDRNIVEEITDPFVHMIRNSVDHGIEDAEGRAASAKDPTAYVTLEAFHQGGFIILRLSDDGRGLRADKILEKAVQKGLLSPSARPDEKDVYKLIFEPGFSTAERVTDISGRGVGMDVVRRQIEKLRGKIEIDSTPGRGCTFTLKLPLTLAMVDGLVLESGGQRYVLPIYSVREMFHMTEEKVFTVENRAEMVLLRGALLPVVRLDRFFCNPRQGEGAGEIGIVVEGRTRQFCLIVDRMVGKQEVVIKALGPYFSSVKGVAGGAILGDGRVGLILDVHGIDGGDASET